MSMQVAVYLPVKMLGLIIQGHGKWSNLSQSMQTTVKVVL